MLYCTLDVQKERALMKTENRIRDKFFGSWRLGVLALALIVSFSQEAWSEVPVETIASEKPDLAPVELAPVELAQEDLRDSSIPEKLPAEAAKEVEIPLITTTRPSFTDAVITVPQGSLQIESGATYTDNRGGTYSWVLPETLFRQGLTENTEIRFSTPNYLYLGDRQPGNLVNNFGDISVAMSHHMVAPGKIDLAFIPILNIPTGANKASSNALDPQLRLVWGRYLTPKWLISGMLDTRYFGSKDASAKVVMNPTLINYYSFSDKYIGFLEYGGFIPTQGRNTQFVQSGLLFLPTHRQQWDVRIAVGLNKSSPNIIVGFGYSFRVDGLFGKSRDFSSFKREAKAPPIQIKTGSKG